MVEWKSKEFAFFMGLLIFQMGGNSLVGGFWDGKEEVGCGKKEWKDWERKKDWNITFSDLIKSCLRFSIHSQGYTFFLPTLRPFSPQSWRK